MGNCIADLHATSQAPSTKSIPWSDLRIYWDADPSILALTNGEAVTATIEDVEDVRGCNGRGKMLVTNLRLIWTHQTNPSLNLSIGLGVITYIHFNMVESSTLGRVRAPHLMTQYQDSHYDFTFATTSICGNSFFQTLDVALRRYRATKVFRSMTTKETSSSESDKYCVLYYGEMLVLTIPCCKCTRQATKREGKLLVTTKRLIWIGAFTGKALCLSIPFLSIGTIQWKKLHGNSMLAVCLERGFTACTFSFPDMDSEAFVQLFTQMELLHRNAYTHPFFGPLDGVVQFKDGQYSIVAPYREETEDNSEALLSKEESLLERYALVPDALSVEGVVLDLKRTDQDQLLSVSEFKVKTLLTADDTDPRDQDTTQCSSQADEVQPNVMLSQTKPPEMIPSTELSFPYGSGIDSLSRPIRAESLLPACSNHGDCDNLLGRFSAPPSHSSKLIRRCIVCVHEDSEIAFDPCGHFCSCRLCAEKLRLCPLCRTDIGKSLKIYF